MDIEQVQVGQRVRINVPGIGDHGQAGTLRKVQDGKCYIHVDWDQRLRHLVMFYPEDLEHLRDTEAEHRPVQPSSPQSETTSQEVT